MASAVTSSCDVVQEFKTAQRLLEPRDTHELVPALPHTQHGPSIIFTEILICLFDGVGIHFESLSKFVDRRMMLWQASNVEVLLPRAARAKHAVAVLNAMA
ncbi:hypothetical protein MY3296_008708 [Beauveria thailandica]